VDANTWATSEQCDTSACVEVMWVKSPLSAESWCVEVGWVVRPSDAEEDRDES